MPTLWRTGTMGFSYAPWKGVFYPADLPQDRWLSWYASSFNCVELDTTFYACPPPERVKKWATQVPDNFRFAAKVPKQATHADDPVIAREALIDFLRVIQHLGPKLGPLVLQFPPSLHNNTFGQSLLTSLLSAVPENLLLTAEFRHKSWWTPATEKQLQDHNTAWIAADYVGHPDTIVRTADFSYVRWIGQHERYPAMNHHEVDPTSQIAAWIPRLEGLAFKEIWGFFNNDYAGYSVASANILRQLLGEIVRPPSLPQSQLPLF